MDKKALQIKNTLNGWKKLQSLKEAGYINAHILSLDLYQGQQLIESKSGNDTSHTIAVCGNILEKSLGSDQINLAKAPVF